MKYLLILLPFVFQNHNSFLIEEANVRLEATKNWELVSKTGKLDYGKVQYSFSHPHVQGEGRLINPSLIRYRGQGELV